MEVKERTEQKTLAIRLITPVEKLSEVMGASFGEIAQYLQSQWAYPAGPPYAMYFNMDMSNLDVAMGFPVQGDIAGNDRIKRVSIPAGKTATIMHTGPYDKIEEAYNALTAFVKEKELETEPICYEFYLNDPREVKPEELKTEIFFPIKS